MANKKATKAPEIPVIDSNITAGVTSKFKADFEKKALKIGKRPAALAREILESWMNTNS